MTTRIYASESATYRAGQNIEDTIADLMENGMNEAEAKLKGVEQFAIECAILKVHGSEVLDYVVDEGVQIYGGMGYSAEAPMDRAYRDARINRIFEGTNEINRLLSVDMLLKRALKGELDLMTPAMAVQKELLAIPDFSTEQSDELFATEKNIIRNIKKAVLMVAGAAVQKFMQDLAEEQEIIMNIADMLIELYVIESTLLRTEKLVGVRGEAACALHIDMTRLYLSESLEKIATAGREAINSFATGDEQRGMLMGIKRFTKMDPLNRKEIRRRIAEQLISENKFQLW
jgi:hypothetical protein